MEITEGGRSGDIVYRESGGAYSTWWEFAAGPRVLAFIAVPSPDWWDRQVPWAAGRREEILVRIASEVIRQKAPAHGYAVGDEYIDILYRGFA